MGEHGRLVLIGTPLGNREDLSPRAERALREADLLLCEDTRSPLRLVGDVPLPPRTSCFVGNEHERVALLLERLAQGQTVGYVSEAGMPVWSDPGQLLVDAALEHGYAVDVVPGPTAATTALALSGFSAIGARFWGFVPRDGEARRERIDSIVADVGASVLYEAGPRVPALLRDLTAAMPDADRRRGVVARELTKLHQEVVRAPLQALAERFAQAARGEVTLVVEGATPQEAATDRAVATARAVFEAMTDPDLRPRERAKRVAAAADLDARWVYERLVERDRNRSDP